MGTACGFKQERLSWVVHDPVPVHELVVLARERGGSVRLGRTTALPRSASRPNRVFFVAPMVLFQSV
jgi:hypothetical protein